MSGEFYVELTGRDASPTRVGPFVSTDVLIDWLEDVHPKGEMRVLKVTTEEVDPYDDSLDEEETTAPEQTGISEVSYHDYTSDELTEEIRRRNDLGADLPISGSKDEIVERLRADDADPIRNTNDDTED